MTEARLRELQQINGCKNCLQEILENIDTKGVEVTINVDHYDVQYASMHAQLHPEFFDDFKQFLAQQYAKYKEAFDNA